MSSEKAAKPREKSLTDQQIDAIYDALPKRGPEESPYYSRTAIRLIGDATLEALRG